MGLDMYLKAKKYVGGWSHYDDEEKALFKQILQVVGTEDLVALDSPSVEVSTTVAYWRKANAIHSWFVRELAGGKDENQSIHVPVEALEKLVAGCFAALDLYEAGEVEKAGECMKPQAGFFFGSCEVDDWWAETLKDTIRQLTPLLAPKVCEKFSFYYRASW